MSSLRKQEMGHCDPWRRQDLKTDFLTLHDSFLVSQAHIDHLAFLSQVLVLQA